MNFIQRLCVSLLFVSGTAYGVAICKADDPAIELANYNLVSNESNAADAKPEVVNECQGILERLDELAKKTRKDGGRWFLGEYDFDSRGYNVLHFMGHSPLPFGFSVWGFIDIEGAEALGANREDLATYFLEIDVKKQVFDRAGLIGEVNDLQGDGNAIGRFGFYWLPELPGNENRTGRLAGEQKIGFKIFPLETDSRGWQASMNWSKKFEKIFGGRISAGGFVDLNMDAGPTQDDLVVVSEHQIRYRLFEGLHLITEFRLNEFLSDDFGVAPGLQYRY